MMTLMTGVHDGLDDTVLFMMALITMPVVSMMALMTVMSVEFMMTLMT
jgi:hypothetical protein